MKRQHKILFTIFVSILLMGMVSATMAAPGPLTLTTQNPINGIAGEFYSHAIVATGGEAPYTYSLVSGRMPDGLSLNEEGVIEGTPTSAGAYGYINIRVTDANNQYVSRNYTIRITLKTIDFNVTNVSYIYEKGTERTATVTATEGNYLEGTDYTVTYSGAEKQTNAGIYNIVVTLKPHITARIGTLSNSFLSIAKSDEATIAFDGEKNKIEYIGEPQDPFTVIVSPADIEYNILYRGIQGTVYGPTEIRPTAVGIYSVTSTITSQNHYQKSDSGTLKIHEYVSFTMSGESEYDKTEKQATIIPSVQGLVLSQDYYINYLKEDKVYYSLIDAGVYTPIITLLPSAMIKGYVLKEATGEYKIKPKPVTITGLSAVSRDYDGTNRVNITGGYIEGNLDDRDLTSVFPRTGTVETVHQGIDKEVSFGELLITGKASANYVLVEQPTIVVNITPKQIKPIAEAKDKTYDGGTRATVVITFNSADFIKGDKLTATAKGDFETSHVGENLNVILSDFMVNSITGNGKENYAVLNPDNPTANITKLPAPIVTEPMATDVLATTVKSYSISLDNIITEPSNIGTKSYAIMEEIDNSNFIETATINSGMLDINTNNNGRLRDKATIKIAIISNDYETAYVLVSFNVISVIVDFTITNIEKDYNSEEQRVTITNNSNLVEDVDFKVDYRLSGMGSPIIPEGAGQYSLAIEFIEAGKYKIGNITGYRSLIIRKKPVTITNLLAPSRAYNGSNIVNLSGGVIDGKIEGDDLGFTMPLDATMADKDIGENKPLTFTPITLTGDRASSYDLIAQPIISANITSKIIKPIVNITPKKYDGNRNANTFVDFTGLIEEGDAVTATVTGLYADAMVGENKTVYLGSLNVVGNEKGNYSISQPDQPTGDIIKKDAILIAKPSDLTVKPSVAGSYNFDIKSLNIKETDMGTVSYTVEIENDSKSILDGIPSINGSIVNIKIKDTVAALDTAAIKINVHSQNYEDSSTILNLVTGKLEVVFTITDNTAMYNAQAKGVTVTSSIPTLIEKTDYNIIYKQAGVVVSPIVVGTYDIEIEMIGDKALTHTIAEIKGSKILNINKKTISVIGLEATAREYDGSTSVGIVGGTISGKIEGDNVDLVIPSTGTIMDKKQGKNKAVTYAAIMLAGTAANNYALSDANPKLYVDIIPKKIKPIAKVISKEFNNNRIANVNIDFSEAGLLESGDILTAIVTGTFDNANAGIGKTVTLSNFTVTSGNNDGNYSVTIPDNPIGDINKANTATAEAISDMTIPAIANREHIFDLASIKVNANNAGVLTYAATEGTDADNIISSVAIAGDKLKITTGAAVTALNTASINIVISSTNYEDISASLGIVVGEVTINFAISNNTLQYNGKAQAPTIITNPIINVSDYTVEYMQNGVKVEEGAMDVGAYTMNFIFAEGSGYSVGTTVNNSFNIVKKDISIDGLVAENREYNAIREVALNRNEAIINGKIAGEDVDFVAPTTGTILDAGHGNGKAVSFGDITLTGVNMGNYNLVSQPVITVDIIPKSITPIATVKSKTYNASALAVVELSFANGDIIAEDNVTVTATGEFAQATAGSDIAVSLSNIEIIGNDAGNYNISMPTDIKGNIERANLSNMVEVKGLTITSNEDKIYDYDLSTINFGVDDMGDKNYTISISEDTGSILNGIPKIEGQIAKVAVNAVEATNNIAKLKVIVSSQNYNDCTANINVYVDVNEVDFTISDSEKEYSGAVMYPTITTLPAITEGKDYTIEYKLHGTGDIISPQSAGVYDLIITIKNSKYTVGKVTGSKTFTINPKNVTIEGLLATSRQYNGSNSVNLTGGTITGIIEGDEVLANMPILGTLDNKNHGDDKPITFTTPIALTGAGAKNYALLAQPIVTANIAPKDIVPKVIVETKPYDTITNAKATFDFAGLMEAGDTTIVATTTANFVDAEIGSDKVVVLSNTSTISGNEAENYNIIYPTKAVGEIGKALATIEKPAPVTVVANDVLRFDIASLGFNSLATGEKTYAAEVYKDDDNIIESSVLEGSVINYTISGNALDRQSASIKITVSTPNTQEAVTYLNINTGVVGIDFTISNNSVVYNSEIQGVIINTLPENLIGKCDVIYTLVGDDTKKSIDPIAVGNYNVEIKIKDSEGGYIINNIVGNKTLEITKKTVSISGKIAIDREYNGTDIVALSADLAIIEGKVGSDDIGLTIPATGTVANKEHGENKDVTFEEIVLTGADAINYELNTQPTISASIAPKKVTPTYTINTRAYDGTKNIAIQASFAEGDILAGDNIVVTAIGELTNADAGEQTVTVEPLNVVGNEKGNYEIVQGTLPTVIITKASGLTVNNLPNLGVSPSIEKTYDIDLSTLVFNKTDMGDKLYTASIVVDGNSILGTPIIEGNILKIPVKNTAVKGNKAGIAITVNSKNYEACTANVEVEVKNIAINFAISENVKIYNGQAQGVTISSTPAIDASNYEVTYRLNGVGADVAPIDVGLYTVKIAVKADTGYVIGMVEDKMLSIEKKTVNPIASAAIKTYDGTLNAALTFTFAEGDIADRDKDNLVLMADGYFDTAIAGKDKNISIGDIRVSGIAATNYNVLQEEQARNIVGEIIKANPIMGLSKDIKVSRRRVDTIEIDANNINLTKDDTGLKSYVFGEKTDVNDIIESFSIGEDGKTLIIVTKEGSEAGQSATIPLTVRMENYEDSIVNIVVKVENAVVNFTFDKTRYLTDGESVVIPIITNSEVPEITSYTVSYTNKNDNTTELKTVGIYDVVITMTDTAYTIGEYPTTIELIAKKDIIPIVETIKKEYTGEIITWVKTFSFDDADLTEGKDIIVTATASFADENIGDDKAIVFSDLTITGTDSEYYNIVLPINWVGSVIPYENIELIGANVPTANMSYEQRETFAGDRSHNGYVYSVQAWGNDKDYDMIISSIIVYEGKDFDFTPSATAKSDFDITMICKDSNGNEISSNEELIRGVYTLEYQTTVPDSPIIKRYLVVLGKLGDVNEDGVVNSIDANYLESGVWHGGVEDYPSGYGYRTYDVNGDGIINKDDATAIYMINKKELNRLY